MLGSPLLQHDPLETFLMRIATWNINGLRARLDFIKLWLEARQPNVVGLQELKTPTEDFPHDFFAELGYRALVHGQKSWNGVAILTNMDAEHRQSGLPGEEAWGARLITAEIEGGLEFTTVYCPNGKSVEHDDYPAVPRSPGVPLAGRRRQWRYFSYRRRKNTPAGADGDGADGSIPPSASK